MNYLIMGGLSLSSWMYVCIFVMVLQLQDTSSIYDELFYISYVRTTTNKTVFDSTLLMSQPQSLGGHYAVIFCRIWRYFATINATAAFSLTSVGYLYHYKINRWYEAKLEKNDKVGTRWESNPKHLTWVVTLPASVMVEEGKDLGDLDKRLHAWSWWSRPERRLMYICSPGPKQYFGRSHYPEISRQGRSFRRSAASPGGRPYP